MTFNDHFSCLGIESSCDETSISIVRSDKTILLNEVFSQHHSKYGGVVPELSARKHLETVDIMLENILQKIVINSVSAISVTSGPGLIGGLIIGIMTAKTLSSVLKKPIYPINHLEGHALTMRLVSDIDFPFLLLLLSGGHCQILVVRNVSNYFELGSTLDDSIGETFDKVANMLGLGYPGGPIIEKLAQKGDGTRFPFPQPLKNSKCCNFSFSGLKTAVRNTILELKQVTNQDINDISASLQYTISEILKKKLLNSINTIREHYPQINTIVLSGGVAANQFIKKQLSLLAQDNGFSLFSPPINLCTDNAAMISWAAIEQIKNTNIPPSDLSFSPKSSWALSDLKPY